MADCLATLYGVAPYEQNQVRCTRLEGFRTTAEVLWQVGFPGAGSQSGSAQGRLAGCFYLSGVPVPGKARSLGKAVLSLRLGLLNPDSSCTPEGVSTESEMPENGHAQLCASF